MLDIVKPACGDTFQATVDALSGTIDVLNAAAGGKKFALIAAALRNSGSGWGVIDDTAHAPINIDSVSNDTQQIILDYATLGVTKIGTVVVGVDETYGKLGYVAGGSVGKEVCNVKISRVAGNRSAGLLEFNANAVAPPFNDVTIGMSSFAYDPATKFITVNHNDFGFLHWTYQPVIIPRRACPGIVKLETVTEAQTKFFFEDNAGVKIAPPEGAQFIFSRGADFIAQDLDPNLVANPIGNFWVAGIHEVEY